MPRADPATAGLLPAAAPASGTALSAVFLGLAVPDLAIVLFIGFGLLALPFIAAARRAERPGK